MIIFLKNAFRRFVAVYFWVLWVSCAIAGGKIGHLFDSTDRYGDAGYGYAFLGVLVGAFIGIGIGIAYAGFVATIIAIEENTAKTFSLLKKNAATSTIKKNTASINTDDSFDVGTAANEQGRPYDSSRWDSL
jgi:hypothetical protein